MKSIKLFFTIMFVAAITTVSLGQTIVGSAHDFSAQGWGTTEICEACHTPHNADLTVVESPLWNHAVTGETFQPYTGSGTLNATVGQPDGISKLCLSCHDGVTNMDAFGGGAGTTPMTSGNVTGLDLRNDHPISFTYDAALVGLDPGLHAVTTTSGLGGTIDSDMLFNTQLECSSCHDVHNGLALPNLLRKTNVASALCLTCHAK